jgi:hypothetical protein
MKLLKLAIRLSVAANILLVFFYLRHKDEIQELKRKEQETTELFNEMTADLVEIEQGVIRATDATRKQHYRIIAQNEQTDAFLEEYRENNGK